MNFIMPRGTREMLERMRDRRDRREAQLRRRVEYGGKKGRSAARRLRRMGPNPFAEPERVIATLWGPEWAKAPYSDWEVNAISFSEHDDDCPEDSPPSTRCRRCSHQSMLWEHPEWIEFAKDVRPGMMMRGQIRGASQKARGR